MKVHTKLRYVTEFFDAVKIALVHINRNLQSVYWAQTTEMNKDVSLLVTAMCMNKCVLSIAADFYEHSLQALVQRW